VRRILEGRMVQALIRMGPIHEEARSLAMDRLRVIEESYKEGEAA